MNTIAIGRGETGAAEHDSLQPCPYFHETGTLCRASSSVLVIDARRRRRFCACDDHDRCAIFLAKALRAEPPTGFSLYDLQEK